MGYILDVGPIQKSSSFSLQFQNEENRVERFTAYNISQHRDLLKYMETGQAVKIELMRNVEGRVTFGSYCKVFAVSVTDILFPLNSSLKENIIQEKKTRYITIEELKKIDPAVNTEKFTIRCKILIGNDDMEEISTRFGPSRIKRDIHVQDTTGTMNMQMFENKLNEIKSGEFFEIKCVALQQFRSNIYIGLTKDTLISPISKIEGLKEQEFPSSSSCEVVTDGFESIKNLKVFYYCKACKKQVAITDVNAEWEHCTKCGAQSRVRRLNLRASVEVNFMVDDEKDMWAVIFPDVMDKICPKITSASALETSIKDVSYCRIMVKDDVVTELYLEKTDVTKHGDLHLEKLDDVKKLMDKENQEPDKENQEPMF